MDSMSDAEKIAYLRKWAELGNADAQNKLGLKYYNGLGITQDKVEAVKWYRKSADSRSSIFMTFTGRRLRRVNWAG